MRTVLISVAVAFQFLTVVPPPLRRTVTPAELGMSVTFFPLVGLLMGLLLFGLHGILSAIFPVTVAAAILVAIWIACSGALHFDGLLDAVDGLLGGRTPEDRMRILRDERVGAFAVAAGAIVILLKYAAIAGIGVAAALIFVPVVGRWLTSMSVVLFSYARTDGLGRDMKDNAGWPQAVGATAIAAATLGILAPSVGFAATGAAVILACFSGWLLVSFTLSRIPGLTGDIYGALCEVGETVCIVTLAANWAA